MPDELELEIAARATSLAQRSLDPPVVRVAATADIHLPRDPWEPPEDVASSADILVVAGDVTALGTLDEAASAGRALRATGLPVVVVLGNHDHHSGRAESVAQVLVSAGIAVLEGDALTLDVRGIRVGIAGIKGFGGGFEGATAHEFGEDLMKNFVAHTRERAAALRAALNRLDTDIRVALVHYAPTSDTLAGEPVGLYPFLGSYMLGEAIDEAGADLVLHGHAHLGSERGFTPGGIPVRNVAVKVIGAPLRVYELGAVRAATTRDDERFGQQRERGWIPVDGGRLWDHV